MISAVKQRRAKSSQIGSQLPKRFRDLSNAQLATKANELQDAIDADLKRISDHARAALVKARQVGQILLVVKERVGHGKWGEWLKKNFNKSHNTADIYMRVAKSWKRVIKPELEAHPNLTLQEVRQLVARPTFNHATKQPADQRRSAMRRFGQLVAETTPDEQRLLVENLEIVFQKMLDELRPLVPELSAAKRKMDEALDALTKSPADDLDEALTDRTCDQDDIHTAHRFTVRKLGRSATSDFQRQILDAECPVAGIQVAAAG